MAGRIQIQSASTRCIAVGAGVRVHAPLVLSNWILAAGTWNDGGEWDDTATWID